MINSKEDSKEVRNYSQTLVESGKENFRNAATDLLDTSALTAQLTIKVAGLMFAGVAFIGILATNLILSKENQGKQMVDASTIGKYAEEDVEVCFNLIKTAVMLACHVVIGAGAMLTGHLISEESGKNAKNIASATSNVVKSLASAAGKAVSYCVTGVTSFATSGIKSATSALFSWWNKENTGQNKENIVQKEDENFFDAESSIQEDQFFDAVEKQEGVNTSVLESKVSIVDQDFVIVADEVIAI